MDSPNPWKRVSQDVLNTGEKIMKVLVTGGCGFIGSHVCEFYRELGWEVVSYDNMTKYELNRTGYKVDRARTHNSDFLHGIGVELHVKDIRNLEGLLASAKGCDYIVHTAAQPAMTLSLEDPLLDLTTNVLGTCNVLEASRRYRVPAVICSTIHVYGTSINDTLREEETRYVRTPPEIDESHPTMTGTLTPLHASKYSGENYVLTYIHSYQLQAAAFRLTGLYGPRQFGGEDHGWVANFAIRAHKNQPITLFGTGKQVRDILYATDVCKAFHAFFENPVPGIYNIGGGIGTSISLLECIQLLQRILGKEIALRFGGERLGDLYYFISNTKKAQELLHWTPSIAPEQGVRELVEWVVENHDMFE